MAPVGDITRQTQHRILGQLGDLYALFRREGMKLGKEHDRLPLEDNVVFQMGNLWVPGLVKRKRNLDLFVLDVSPPIHWTQDKVN
jgi:hypothetical protein